jgi:hypothetical protein
MWEDVIREVWHVGLGVERSAGRMSGTFCPPARALAGNGSLRGLRQNLALVDVPGREGEAIAGRSMRSHPRALSIVRLVTEPRYQVACSNCGRGAGAREENSSLSQ